MLITVEGVDGSGKSSALAALEREWTAPVFTREPTDSWYGEAVSRSIANPDADPLAELFLYTADHADHLARVVHPALEADRPVISDRYSDSRFAYQGVSLEGVVPDPVSFVRSVHRPWSRPPDRTIYLDIDPETAARRSEAANKFESVAFLEDVRANYERLIEAEPDRFVRIDATDPEPVVADRVREAIVAALEGSG